MLNNLFNRVNRKFSKIFIPEGVPSYPYISGDTFCALAANVCLNLNGKIIIKRKNFNNNVFFINVDLFNKMELDNILPSGSRLIIHNGDASPDLDKLRTISQTNVKVFTSNLPKDFSTPGVTGIPIGLENAHWATNGRLNYYLNRLPYTEGGERSPEILVTFSVETNIKVRNYYLKLAEKYGCYNRTGLSVKRYSECLSRYMFILSPPGNGLDCHRTWEAIYHGCVPVMESKDNLFSEYDLPIYEVENLSDFFELSEDKKIEIFKKIKLKKPQRAYMDYWILKVLI